MDMQRLGFVHDILDVKCLILFIMARASFSATGQQIYEMCFQDECVSYFDVFTALPQMVESGHLIQKEDGTYEITDKGRADGELTKDSIAYTVRCRAENAVNRFNRMVRRSSSVRTQIVPLENGEYTVLLSLNDDTGNLMTLELSAPNQRQAVRLTKLYERNAERVYNSVMAELLSGEDEIDN